jgi:hypothetical protein
MKLLTTQLINKTMKTLNSKLTNLVEFLLTNEEMINVRGGENDPIIKATIPPIVI